ncbi:MAG: hypothetical protein AAF799_42785 [Myxococcota bacterium]
MRLAAVGLGLGVAVLGCARTSGPGPGATVVSPEPSPDPAVSPDEEPPIEAAPTEVSPPAQEPAETNPSGKQVHELVTGEVTPLGSTVELDADRVVGAWRRFDPQVPGEADIVLAIVGPDGVQHLVFAHHVATPWLGEEPPHIDPSLTVDDYDDDGRPEVRMVLTEEIMCPGGGPNVIRTMMLFDTEPKLAKGLQIELDHEMLAGDTVTQASVAFEDLDGDGHRDVRVVYVMTDAEGERSEAENRWLWLDKDRWTFDRGDYHRYGCDW